MSTILFIVCQQPILNYESTNFCHNFVFERFVNCDGFYVKYTVMAPIFCPCRKNKQKIVKKIKDWLFRCDEQDNGY